MSDSKVKLVLASASPRRLALLEQAGLTADLLNPVDIDETQSRRETPRALSEGALSVVGVSVISPLNPGVQ